MSPLSFYYVSSDMNLPGDPLPKASYILNCVRNTTQAGYMSFTQFNLNKAFHLNPYLELRVAWLTSMVDRWNPAHLLVFLIDFAFIASDIDSGMYLWLGLVISCTWPNWLQGLVLCELVSRQN